MSRIDVVDPSGDTAVENATGSPRRQQTLECQGGAATSVRQCRGASLTLQGGAATPVCQCPSVTLNEIHQLAYRKWQLAGMPPGDTTRFWLEAERELLETR